MVLGADDVVPTSAGGLHVWRDRLAVSDRQGGPARRGTENSTGFESLPRVGVLLARAGRPDEILGAQAPTLGLSSLEDDHKGLGGYDGFGGAVAVEVADADGEGG